MLNTSKAIFVILMVNFIIFNNNVGAVDYKDIEVIDIPNNSDRKKNRNCSNKSNITINNNIVIDNNTNNDRSQCLASGYPSFFLPFGSEINFNVKSSQTEYWFCINSPYHGFDVGVKGGFFSPILYDSKMNHILNNQGSSGGGCQIHQFGGKGDDLPKGKYFLKLRLLQKISGVAFITLIRNEGSHLHREYCR